MSEIEAFKERIIETAQLYHNGARACEEAYTASATLDQRLGVIIGLHKEIISLDPRAEDTSGPPLKDFETQYEKAQEKTPSIGPLKALENENDPNLQVAIERAAQATQLVNSNGTTATVHHQLTEAFELLERSLYLLTMARGNVSNKGSRIKTANTCQQEVVNQLDQFRSRF